MKDGKNILTGSRRLEGVVKTAWRGGRMVWVEGKVSEEEWGFELELCSDGCQ